MNSVELVEDVDGLSYRKLDYWCAKGIFGADKMRPGYSSTRSFSQEDLEVARVLARVSSAFTTLGGRGGPGVALYDQLADQIRTCSDPAVVTLGPGVHVVVDLETEEP